MTPPFSSSPSPPPGTLTGFEPIERFLRLMETWGHWGWDVTLITAPYCTSWGFWRAEVRAGARIELHYTVTDLGVPVWEVAIAKGGRFP